MDHLPLSDNASRQAIDAATVFEAHRRVEQEARSYVGGMYWKHQGPYEYLVRTLPDNRQHRIGSRSAETEAIYKDFTGRKAAVEARRTSLRAALKEAERLNKALKAGRVPAKVVAVLQALEDAGLGEHCRVVGSHALYAYETAAGVRLERGAFATQDVDHHRGGAQRLSVVVTKAPLVHSMLPVLQKAEPSFRCKAGQAGTAVDNKGFEVDFLSTESKGGHPHLLRFLDDRDDEWPVRANRAAVLTTTRPFEQLVISTTGRMVLMRALDPAVFISSKRWMAKSAPNRSAPRRRHDAHQADLVERLWKEGLLVPSCRPAL